MPTDLILGTAGHIDHGKTSLIRALTGINTDRLPEEKQRGITIELGFAELLLGDYRLGVVDVPGHERFVRNMLAGATGMDVALLVVAADDSIKQQTREHLEILRLLDLEAGVIAITKADLAEPDWIELVEEEIRSLAADSFLAAAPIVRTSVETGDGLEELKRELTAAAEKVARNPRRQKRLEAPFRMAIDRVFTMAGHGAVVTGSVSSGKAALGDILRIEPDGIEVRVRGLQNHDRSSEEIHRGQRAAINLAGVHHDQIGRGRELASQDHLRPSRLCTVWLSLLESTPRPLKNRSRIRLHVGAAEFLATVSLLDREKLEPGESAPAQVFLTEPAAVIWSQPFVLRSESPVATIGGGRVLDPAAPKLKKPDQETLQQILDLRSSEPQVRASAALYFAGLDDWSPRDLARSAGLDDGEAMREQLRESGDLQEIRLSPTRTLSVHRRVLEQIAERVEAALRKMHELNPLRSTLDRSQLASGFRYLGDDALLEAVLRDMQKAKQIRLSDRGISLVGCGPKLSQNERKLLVQLIEIYREAGLQSPTVKECQQQVSKNQQSVPQLVSLAAADGDLVEIAADYYLHADVERQAKEQLRQRLAEGGASMSEIRELLGTSRKYAVPFCEYLDRIGFTKREEDLRVLGS